MSMLGRKGIRERRAVKHWRPCDGIAPADHRWNEVSRDARPVGTASRDTLPKPTSEDASPKPPPRSPGCSLRAPCIAPPAPDVAIETRLIGDADRLVADMQAVPAALDPAALERQFW